MSVAGLLGITQTILWQKQDPGPLQQAMHVDVTHD